MPLQPGQSLAHYRIVRQIGEGGMGAVFLAQDTKLDRQVALKVLPPQMASDPDRLERFRREAKAIAALNHPHIVTIHSVEEEGGTHFLTMELVEGASLDRGLPSGGLPLTKVFDIGIALADALAAAHEKRIIHRDLKPANVMLTKDGRVKVLDFGLAKLAPGSAGGAPGTGGDGSSAPTRTKPREGSLTDAGQVVGTMPYMSPEQIGGETVDARTDIFSLGVVLYELATGHRPFGGRNAAETISSILRDAPRPVTEARQDAPRHLGRIIEHCLQKEPEARFQTAKDVRNQLRALRMEAGTTEAPSALLSGSAAASGETGAADRSRRGWWIAPTAGAVLIAAALLWIGRDVFWPQRDAAPTVSGGSGQEPATVVPAMTTTASIAVLPFVDMSPDKNQEYFSDGLSEELINVLARIPELRVTGRTSSFSFKGQSEDLKSIGEKLGVANILEGSVRKAGDRVRITAQLVKAADGFHIWSQTYDRSLDDIFAVQDDIAGSVARELRVRLLPKAGVLREADTAAFDFELQARFVLNTRSTPASHRVAGEILERGLAVAPGDARLWRTKARLHYREVLGATTIEARGEALKQARAALVKVLELDPNMNADTTMAWSHCLAWEFAEAERSFGRALDVESSASNAAGIFYLWMGRPAEAIALFDRAVELDPLDVRVRENKASACLEVGRLDEAETLLRLALDLSPEWSSSYHTLFELHMLRGEMEEARMALARYGELANQADYWLLFADAVTETVEGRAASSAAAAEFEERFGSDNPMECARIRAWRGEADAAFAWLDKALAARDPLLARVKSEIGLRSLRTDPRWNILLRKVGLPTD